MRTANGKSNLRVLALGIATVMIIGVACPASIHADFNRIFFGVNGDTTQTTMVQGDELFWGSNCDSGATINWEIWFDGNSNSAIEPGTDFMLTTENITDGDWITEPNAMLDGFSMSESFLLSGEPGLFIFRATDVEADSSLEKVMTMTAMPSPPNQLSGRITVPGVTPPNSLLANKSIFAESESGGEGAFFGMTDNMGDYTIDVGASGTGVDFALFPSSVPGFVAPNEQFATASGVVSGIDFTYETAVDSVYGLVRDGTGTVLNFETQIAAESWTAWRSTSTVNGRYVIYFSDADVSQWSLEVDSRLSPLFLTPDPLQFNLDILGSFAYDIILPNSNSVIYVRVTEEGAPATSNYRVLAYSSTLNVGTEAVSGTGSDNIAALHVTAFDPNNWYIWLNTNDDEFPLPPGLVVENDAGGVAPGDTVTINLTAGHQLSGTVSQDPEDGPIDWNEVYVGAGGAGATPDGAGNYQLYVPEGFHSLGAWADGYLVTPQTHDMMVTTDISGLDFTINETHCLVTGTLQNVSLPLMHEWYTVSAATGTGPFDGYYATTFVDPATGTYEISLCDGDWTITPPVIDGAATWPPAVEVTIGESPDNARTIDFDYVGSGGCCEGRVGDANGEGGDEPTIGDIAVLVDALYITLDWSPVTCLTEADVNQSGGADPVSGDGGDITIGDISLLVDRLFITNDWTLLPDCL